MRDADDDEETRVFSGGADAVSAPPSPARAAGLPPPRAEGLPPPRVEKEALGAAQAELAAGDDDDATQLMPAASATKQPKWVVSDGPNAPMDLSHDELRAALSSGKVSRAALAWQKGMREWQKVSDIPTLNGALPPLSSPRSSPAPSSPPPKRPSRPRSAPRSPRPGKLVAERPPSPLAAALSSDAPLTVDTSEADTPPSGSMLPRASVSTADFSEITPAHTPQSQRAQQLAATSKPERIEIAPVPAVSARPAHAAQHDNAKATIHTPRPAAGRPPAPGEPVAKTPDVPPAQGAREAKVVINEPPFVVVATGLAQAKLNPTIETQRETTQPARWRPPLRQLRAAGQPPNIVLWVLGAGGWVLSGVLAGILLAKSDPEPVRLSTTPATVTTHAASTHEQGSSASRAATPPTPAAPEPAAIAHEPPVAPAVASAPLPTPNAANRPQATGPNSAARPIAKAGVTIAPGVAAKDLADPSGLSGPTATKDINTPGF